MASALLHCILWSSLILLEFRESGVCEPIEPGLAFTKEPEDVIAVRSSPLQLNCSASGSGTVNITWRKDGTPVHDSRRYVIEDTGSLYFRRIVHRKQRGRSDEGVYECLAKNQYGIIVSKQITLKIASLSRFSGEPLNTKATVGEVARFQCSIDGVPPPVISWQKNQQPLPQDDRFTVLPSGLLHIVSIEESDAGMYRCRAQNKARHRLSSEAELSVLPRKEPTPIQLLAGPRNQTKVEGDSVSLSCLFSGLPRPVITWDRVDRVPVLGSRFSVTKDGTLHIRDLVFSDQATYVCTARASDSSIQTAQGRLQVLVAPKLLQKPKSESKPLATTNRYVCNFTGVPTPAVSWYKNGLPVQPNGRIKIKPNLMMMSSGIVEDSGLYQCFGYNEAGQASGIFRVDIAPSKNAPEPPTKLVARPVDSYSIELSWIKSEYKAGHDVLAYSVHYLPTGGGSELQKVVRGDRVMIDQLRPYTNYTFYALAYNADGASKYSMKVTQHTEESVPIAAPSPKVFPNGATSLTVKWEVLPLSKSQGIVNQYHIIYRKKGMPAEHVDDVHGSATEYTIRNLEPNQEYDIRVLAGTSKGFPTLDDADWPWVTQVTDPNRSIGAPKSPELRGHALNSSAIKLEWNEPQGSGLSLVGFKLYFHKPTEPKKIAIFPGDVRSHIMTKLDPNSWYEIILLAFNQLGDGEQTVQNIKTQALGGSTELSPPPPPPPQIIEAEPLDENNIRVQWLPPESVTGITSYTVRYTPVQTESGLEIVNSSFVNNIDSVKPEVVVKRLESFAMYQFAVRSNADSVHGPFGGDIRCRTAEGRPSAPTNVRLTLYGPSSVELNWQPPLQKNGLIVQYIIFYRTGMSEEEMHWFQKTENGSVNHAVIHNLKNNVPYVFKLRAETSAGPGPPTKILRIYTRNDGIGPVTSKPQESVNKDREMGIIVGVCIGGGCLIICALIIVFRNRCFPPRQPPTPVNNSCTTHNGCVPRLNGNGYLARHSPYDGLHEMDSFTPMLPQVQENTESDTKGGRTKGSLKQDGSVLLPVNGLRASILPNGRVHTAIDRKPRDPEITRSSSSTAEDLDSNDDSQDDDSQHLNHIYLDHVLNDVTRANGRPPHYLPTIEPDNQAVDEEQLSAGPQDTGSYIPGAKPSATSSDQSHDQSREQALPSPNSIHFQGDGEGRHVAPVESQTSGEISTSVPPRRGVRPAEQTDDVSTDSVWMRRELPVTIESSPPSASAHMSQGLTHGGMSSQAGLGVNYHPPVNRACAVIT